MSKVITFSRVFPAYHPKKGQPTYFVEKFWGSIDNFLSVSEIAELPGKTYGELDKKIKVDIDYLKEPKHHTIRSGNRFKVGDYFSPRVWIGKPYNSKQIIIAPDIEVKKVFDIKITSASTWFDVSINGKNFTNWDLLAKNDGLSAVDMIDWFKYPNEFSGQIICWNENIEY